MNEIVELTEWRFKWRRSNNKGYYEIIKRRDNSYFCSCPSHKYNAEECKHIEGIRAYFGETDVKRPTRLNVV